MGAIGRRAKATAVAAAVGALAMTGAADAKKEAPPKLRTATAVASATGSPNVATATATCPGKTKAVSGGFTTTAPAIPTHWLNVFVSTRMGDNKWRVGGSEYFPGGSDGLTAYAYCQRLKTKIRTVSNSVPLTATVDAGTTAFATCPTGTKILSGGFATPASVPGTFASYVSRSTGVTGSGWVVDATNLEGTAPRTVTAIAYCAQLGRQTERTARVAITGPAGALKGVLTPGCPRKTRARSGGFATSTPVGGLDGAALVYESVLSARSWYSAASASSSMTSSTLVSSASCR